MISLKGGFGEQIEKGIGIDKWLWEAEGVGKWFWEAEGVAKWFWEADPEGV